MHLMFISGVEAAKIKSGVLSLCQMCKLFFTHNFSYFVLVYQFNYLKVNFLFSFNIITIIVFLNKRDKEENKI